MTKHETIVPLGTVLDSLMKTLGIEKNIEQYQIFNVWNSIVGEQIAKVAQPERIHNGVLIVAVSNAPWRTELTFRKKEILEKIHSTLNSTSITDIRFR
ncbi:MAG: DUF721 domain-containing protein [Bacteroidota bacterium]